MFKRKNKNITLLLSVLSLYFSEHENICGGADAYEPQWPVQWSNKLTTSKGFKLMSEPYKPILTN